MRKAEQEVALKPKQAGFNRLSAPEELDLLSKIGFYPQVLIACAKTLEPFALVRYLQELASAFHKFYDAHRVLDEDQELAQERLALIAARLVLGNGLKLLGVNAPQNM